MCYSLEKCKQKLFMKLVLVSKAAISSLDALFTLLKPIHGRFVGGIVDHLHQPVVVHSTRVQGHLFSSLVEASGRVPRAMWLLTDTQPHSLLSRLSSSTIRVGMVAAQTPFHTGYPVTLFHKSHGQPLVLQTEGAVGISTMEDLFVEEHNSLQPMGDALTITQCQGNIVSKLDGQNAAECLGGLVTEKHDVYAALGGHVVQVTAANPYRGTIALDMPNALVPGQTVQFLRVMPSQMPSMAGFTVGVLREGTLPSEWQASSETGILNGTLKTAPMTSMSCSL
jgi:hypothetical protein